MSVIYKYPLIIAREQQLQLPDPIEPLCVQIQDRMPTLWAQVPEHPFTRWRTVEMYGTGHQIPDGVMRRYLGTVQDGAYVWHYFLVLP